jgi:dephospho-CoA kinase
MEINVIGLTGPSGAGKSTLLADWKNLGIACIDADRVYHTLLRSDSRLLSALQARFPAAFFNGELSRGQLAKIVFADEDALADLNAITHPAVVKDIQSQLLTLQEQGINLVALEALYLIESGLSELCSITVAIVSEPNTQMQRLVARDSLTPSQASARLRNQKEDSYYLEHCSHHIVNTGDLKSLLDAGHRLISIEKERGNCHGQ